MPVITVSKQLGAGGEEIARAVCDMLRYRYFDKQHIIETAHEVGLSRDQVVDYSEERYEVRNFLARLMGGAPRPVKTVSLRKEDSKGNVTLTEETIDEAQYVVLIKGAVRAAYERGDMVIVGRAGQAILQDEADALHVRIVAPLGSRIARLQQREGLTVEEAERQIMRHDRASAEYLGRFFGIQWDDHNLYHLMLNTGKVSVDGAAQIIVDAVVQLRASIAG